VGRAIAADVTATEPHPVELEFEKVYLPCVLVAKKRYCGYAYSSESQRSPTYEVKGLESVRRDSCAAVTKAMDRAVRALFDTMGDLSAAKTAMTRALRKIAAADAPVSDFTFANEVRLGSYRGRLPPAALVAERARTRDPMADPQYGERIAYVVSASGPHAALLDKVVAPRTFVEQHGSLRLDVEYYAQKRLIPALRRVLSLAGADVDAWYADVPRGPGASFTMLAGGPPGTLDAHFASQYCVVCKEPCSKRNVLCDGCNRAPETAALALVHRARAAERGVRELEGACRTCSACDQVPIECVSLDCRVYLKRAATENVCRSAQAGLNAAFP
jgi:DNA polymerase zeta